MPILLRLTLSVLFLAFAVFCGYGFLAALEDRSYLVFQVFYGLLGVANFAAIFAVWRPRKRRQAALTE